MGLELPLIELAPVPVIYADGLADVLVIGENVRFTLFEFRRWESREVRAPVVTIIRPVTSCLQTLPIWEAALMRSLGTPN